MTPSRTLDKRIPSDIEAICLKCLENEPLRRFVSAVLVGLAFFAKGSSYWGKCYVFGIAFLVLAQLMPLETGMVPARIRRTVMCRADVFLGAFAAAGEVTLSGRRVQRRCQRLFWA